MKIISPLISNRASGRIAARLVFSDRRTGAQARWQKGQKDKLTEAREARRFGFSIAGELARDKVAKKEVDKNLILKVSA